MFFFSLCDIEENTTKLKKIKVDNEVLDLDCEWEDCSVNLASVRVSGYAPQKSLGALNGGMEGVDPSNI